MSADENSSSGAIPEKMDLNNECSTPSTQDKDVNCEFIVGEKKVVIKENKYLLAGTSPVFLSMFFGDLSEKGPVEMPDIEPDAFNIMIKFMHHDDFEFESQEQAARVCDLAEKYDLNKLKNKCEKFLAPCSINDPNLAIKCARLYNLPVLKKECLKLVQEQTINFLKLESFLSITHELLLEIVKMESMNIDSETQLFNAVVDWAKARCQSEGVLCDGVNLRNKLGDVLKNIRFLSMNAPEFLEGPAKSGLLTHSEVLDTALFLMSDAVPPDTVCQIAKPRNTAFKEVTQIFNTIKYVVSNSLSESIYIHSKTKVIKEYFTFTVPFQGIVGVIVPSQASLDNPGGSYYEEINVKLTAYSSLEGNFEGNFKGKVGYNQEIFIPLFKSLNRSSFQLFSNTTSIISVTFKQSGFYKWHLDRKFSKMSLFTKDCDKPGYIIGFELIV